MASVRHTPKKATTAKTPAAVLEDIERPQPIKIKCYREEKGSRLHKILVKEEKRSVYWAGDKREETLRHYHNRVAAAVTRSGSDAKECAQCKLGRKAFSVCAALPNVGGGACGNCLWNKEGKNCSHLHKDTLTPEARSRLHYTEEEVLERMAANGKEYNPDPEVLKQPRRCELQNEAETLESGYFAVDTSNGTEWSGKSGELRSSKRLAAKVLNNGPKNSESEAASSSGTLDDD